MAPARAALGGLVVAWALATLPLALSGCGSCAVTIRSSAIPPLAGGTATVDGVEIDPQAHRVYLADRGDSGIDVFDTSAAPPVYLTTIGVGAAPNGLALAPDLQRLYVGLNSGAVAVVDTSDPTRYRVVDKVVTGTPEADLLDYSARRQRVYVGTGSAGELLALDPATDTVRARWKLTGSLEQPRYDAKDDTVYVTGRSAKGVIAVDPNTGLYRGPYSLGTCTPAGMALDAVGDQAVIACDAEVVSWNPATHRIIDPYPEIPGGDIVTYDAASRQFIVASPQGSRPSLVAILSAAPVAFEASVTTNAGGHAAVYDAAHKLVLSPDQRPGHAAVLSFPVPACRPLPGVASFAISASVLLLPLLALVVLIVRYTTAQQRLREREQR